MRSRSTRTTTSRRWPVSTMSHITERLSMQQVTTSSLTNFLTSTSSLLQDSLYSAVDRQFTLSQVSSAVSTTTTRVSISSRFQDVMTVLHASLRVTASDSSHLHQQVGVFLRSLGSHLQRMLSTTSRYVLHSVASVTRRLQTTRG